MLRLFWFLIPASIFGKLWLASLGHNYDLESYEIVAGLVNEGKSVYANTIRYNYGPVWFYVLGLLAKLSSPFAEGASREHFHQFVAGFLALVDVGVALLTRRLGHPRVACLFLLSPVSWLITGFHSQFDQFPVLLALPAVAIFRSREGTPGRWLVVTALLLGLSLITKHVMIFFPLWLAFSIWEHSPREPQSRRRALLAMALICAAPPVLFLLSFVPWLSDPASRAGIVQNVFRYSSDSLYALVPKALGVVGITGLLEAAFAWVPIFSGYKFVWACGMVALGWHFRRRNPLELLLLYTVALIVLTPALTDQYLVIPALACAYFWRSPWIKAYVALSTVFLLFFSPANLATVTPVHPAIETIRFVPIRRYFAVAFLLVFLVQEWRRERSAAQLK